MGGAKILHYLLRALNVAYFKIRKQICWDSIMKDPEKPDEVSHLLTCSHLKPMFFSMSYLQNTSKLHL